MPGAGEKQKKNLFWFFAVQKPPASREQGHAQACVKNHYQTNKPKKRSAAKRSVSAGGEQDGIRYYGMPAVTTCERRCRKRKKILSFLRKFCLSSRS
jgi:hypothetical protein